MRRSQNTHSWSSAEDEALAAAYSVGGPAAALMALPGRSKASIYIRAARLKIKAPTGAAKLIQNSDHMHPIVRAVLARMVERRGKLTALLAEAGLHRDFLHSLRKVHPRLGDIEAQANTVGLEIKLVEKAL